MSNGAEHELVISPFLTSYLVLRPGQPGAIKIPEGKYLQLQRAAAASQTLPVWLADSVRRAWNIDIFRRPLNEVAIVRDPSLGYGRASYELNMGCNYACKHCYLGLKEFAGLDWQARERLLEIMREAGVLWLQITGGEPMIDRYFAATYTRAYDLGMMVEVLTNGSRLWNPLMLSLLTSRPPHGITLSVYGATEESYDRLTQRRGSFKSFIRGLMAAHEAGLSMQLAIVVTADNAHELAGMRAIGERLGIKTSEYANMSPTIYGGAESLRSQSPTYLTKRAPFTGCDAGHTSFHVDPHGRASMCKIGREPNISLLDEGTTGLLRLSEIADDLLRRQDGCTGCTLSKSCGTCMPLVTLYRKAKAPLADYCQHTERR